MWRSAVGLLALLVSACATVGPPRLPVVPRCGVTQGASSATPFKKGPGLKVLVGSSTPELAARLQRAAVSELSSSEPYAGALAGMEPSENTLQIESLPCAVGDHDQAHAIAEALGADVVLWGGACPGPAAPSSAGSAASAAGAAAPEVCPSATLHHLYRDGHGLPVADSAIRARVDLELPPIRLDEPLSLLHFVRGLSFRERARRPDRRHEWRFAARLYRWAVERTDPRAPHREIYELYAGIAAGEMGDAEGAVELCSRGFDRVKNEETLTAALLEDCLAEGLAAKGDSLGALARHRHALALAQALPDELLIASGSTAIGQILLDRGEPGAALTSLERGLAAFAATNGAESAEAAMAEAVMVSAYAAQHDTGHVIEHGRHALASLEKAWGPDQVQLANLAYQIGDALRQQGELVGALEQARRAASVLAHHDAGRSLVGALVEDLMGTVLLQQHQPAEATEHLRGALAILSAMVGPAHPDVAHVERDLGYALLVQGDQAGALEHDLRALALEEALFGPESEHLIESLTAVGHVQFLAGDLAAAFTNLSRARRISDAAFGPKSLQSSRLIFNVGAVLLDQGSFVEAREHCGYARSRLEAELGPDDPATAGAGKCFAYAEAALSGWKPGAPGAIVLRVKSRLSGRFLPGDWISTYEGTRVRDAAHLAELSAKTADRSALVHVTVVRDKKRVRVPALSGPLELDVY